MDDIQLETSRLLLISQSTPWLEALKKGPAAFKQISTYDIDPDYTEFPESLDYTIDLLSKLPDRRWLSYFVIHKEDKKYIGQSGFTGGPKEGTVEIGYEIVPQYRSKKYGTETVRALLDYAFSYAEVSSVIAHTLASPNASNAILQFHHFIFEEEINDPTDGLIWRWRLRKPAYILSPPV